MDCCQGSGRIWAALGEEFSVASYWPLDQKSKKGRLKIDSSRVLAQPGWTQNVIDVDTYGAPWRHWLALLPNVQRPVTVFLTSGRGGPNRIRLGDDELDAMGLTLPRVRRMSGAITHTLGDLAARFLLSAPDRFRLTVSEAVEAAGRNARYFGLRLEPAGLPLLTSAGANE